MERMATDVAGPPIAGGELPSFDELMAQGSFHARLAEARARRERALAEAESSEDSILNTRRKPWDRDGTAREDDRLITALAAAISTAPAKAVPEKPVQPKPSPLRAVPGATAADPVAVAPAIVPPAVSTPVPSDMAAEVRRATAAGPPAPLPAAPAPDAPAAPLSGAGAAVVPVAPPVPDESPARRLHILPDAARPEAGFLPAPPPSAAPRRRIAMIEGGFLIGLAIGGAVALGLPLVLDRPQGAAPAPAVVVTAPAVPAGLAAAPETLSAPAPVAAPLRRGSPALPGGAAGDGALSRAPGFALAAGAAALPVAPGAPDPVGDLALARPADLGAAAITAGARPTTLSPAAARDAGPRLPAAFAPAMLPADLGHAPSLPAAPAAPPLSLPVPAEAADPLSRSGPAILLATAAVSDAALPAQEPPLAAGPRFAGAVVVNAPDSLTEAEVSDRLAMLSAGGFALADPQRVGVTVKDSNVRFFHPEDAAAAEAVAEALGARLRDFTDFSPPPPAGTIEVWLAGHGSAPAAAPAKARRKAVSAPVSELDALRARILQQLRNGDHL